MEEQTTKSEKPLPPALTDPLLNTARQITPTPRSDILSAIKSGTNQEYQSNLGNPFGVISNAVVPIFDAATLVRNSNSYIEKRVPELLPVVNKLEKDTLKAIALESLKKGGVIVGKAGEAIKKGLSSSVLLENGVKFNPASFVQSMATGAIYDKGIGEGTSTAVTASKVTGALAGGSVESALTMAERALLRGAVAINAASPISVGDSTIEGYNARMRYEQELDMQEQQYFKPYNDAQLERYLDIESKRAGRSREETAKNIIQNIQSNISPTGFKDDHVSAYFKDK